MKSTTSNTHLEVPVAVRSTYAAFNDHAGSYTFDALVPQVTDRDIDAFLDGRARVGVFTHGRYVGLVISIDGFLDRIWTGAATAWITGETGPHLVPVCDRHASLLEVEFCLVDDDDGLLCATRRSALSPHVAKRLLKSCREANAAGPLDDAAAEREVAETLHRYPTPRDAYLGSHAQGRLRD